MLPRAKRLANTKEVALVTRRGQRFDYPYLTLKFFYRQLPATSRAAVVVSNKVSKRAVKRNLLKRIAREAIQNVFPSLPIGDYALIVKPSAIKLDRKTWRSEVNCNLSEFIQRPPTKVSFRRPFHAKTNYQKYRQGLGQSRSRSSVPLPKNPIARS